MAKHEIIIHENTGATRESAPYLGSYVSKETVHDYTFAAALAAKCGLPAIQVQAILTGVFNEIEKLEQESLVRVHLDGFTVCGVIRGSFPSADAAFDPARNALELALRLDEDLKLSLADVTPTIVSDLKMTKLRVDNVMDLAEPKPYNLIHGENVFRVAGFNMELADEGAEVYLQNALGQTFPVVVDEIVSKQLFTAHTATLLEPGDYKLVVKSRAGDAEGPLQTAFRKVKYLKVVAPDPVRVTKIYSSSFESDEGSIHAACFVYIEGENLKLDEDDCVAYSGTRGGNAVYGSFPASRLTENTETTLLLDYTAITGDDFHFDNGSTVTLTIKGTPVTATYRE